MLIVLYEMSGIFLDFMKFYPSLREGRYKTVVTKFINLNLSVVWAVCCALLTMVSRPKFV